MKKIGRYIIILIVVIALWNSFLIAPLKVFTIFLHELGHTIMAFLFGYGIKEFKINFDQSGYTVAVTKGWFSNFMVANGGYLGSVIFASLILYLGRTNFKKYVLGSLAIIFLLVTIKFSSFSPALLYAVLFAGMVIVLYMLQNEKVNSWIIDILGISSVAYAIYDTFVDTILLQLNIYFNIIKGWSVNQPVTDAVQLQHMTGIPAIVWGIIWFGIALLAVNATVFKTGGTSKSRR